MPYAIVCRSTDRDDAPHVEETAAPTWIDVPLNVVDCITTRLPRLRFGAIDVAIAVVPPTPTNKPEVLLACTVPPNDVLRPWRRDIAGRVRDFLTNLESDFADRGRTIRVELRRAPGAPACRAPWSRAERGVNAPPGKPVAGHG